MTLPPFPPMTRVRPGYYRGDGFACDLMPDGSWLLQGDGHRKFFHTLKEAQYWVAAHNREKQRLNFTDSEMIGDLK
jgi:hypothetical protein